MLDENDTGDCSSDGHAEYAADDTEVNGDDNDDRHPNESMVIVLCIYGYQLNRMTRIMLVLM